MTRRFLLALSLMAAGAGGAAAADAPAHQDGEQLYGRMCAPCHDRGFWAANRMGARLGEAHAVLDERDDLNTDYVEMVVRRGMGSMPPYRKTELSESELDAIADYLVRSE